MEDLAPPATAPPPVTALTPWGSPAAATGVLVLGAPSNLSRSQLQLQLVPIRQGDPLGLGAARPPPPEDPDRYDPEEENREFARSALPPEERALLDEEIRQNGFMTIDAVRDLIRTNTVEGSLGSGGIDADMLMLIDSRTNYKIFVGGDNIYTREELYENFPFHEFGTQPEAVFMPQEIGIFPPKATAFDGAGLEYVVRDEGDQTVDFTTIEDMVGREARKNYQARRKPLRIVKTKVYIGKDLWQGFLLQHQLVRSLSRTGVLRLAAAPGGYPAGGYPAGYATAEPLYLDGTEEHRAAAAAATAAAREAELAAREAELAAREAEARRREEEAARREAETAARIERDLRRIEEMLGMAGGRRAAAAAEPATAEPATAEPATADPATADPDDTMSVPFAAKFVPSTGPARSGPARSGAVDI